MTSQEEFDIVLRRNKISKKSAGLDKIPSKVWKTRKFDDILSLCNDVYK